MGAGGSLVSRSLRFIRSISESDISMVNGRIRTLILTAVPEEFVMLSVVLETGPKR